MFFLNLLVILFVKVVKINKLKFFFFQIPESKGSHFSGYIPVGEYTFFYFFKIKVIYNLNFAFINKNKKYLLEIYIYRLVFKLINKWFLNVLLCTIIIAHYKE